MGTHPKGRHEERFFDLLGGHGGGFTSKVRGFYFVRGFIHYAKIMGKARQSGHRFIKTLIGRKDKKILGAHIIGDEASDIIHMIIALMYKQGTLDDLLAMIYIHPALPEARKQLKTS